MSIMKKSHFLLLVIPLLWAFESNQRQSVEVVKFEELQSLMTRDSDQIEVINFWATWCKPCIKELPLFEDLHHQMAETVNVTLISLDFAEELEKKVIPFVKKREIKSRVLLLDEIDYNSWIDKVDPSWSGAIPATLVINHRTGNRKFVENELGKGEIELIIKELTD